MDTREIAIDVIRRMPAGIDFDDIVKMLGDGLYRIECEAFGFEDDAAERLVPTLNNRTIEHASK